MLRFTAAQSPFETTSLRGSCPWSKYAKVAIDQCSSAVPLPATVFDGPRDTRWDFDAAERAFVKVR